MSKPILVLFSALLVGIALTALYLFLVRKFTNSYDTDIAMFFTLVPCALGMCAVYSFAYKQRIIGALVVICTLVFFKFMMGILGVTFSRVYQRIILPKVYKSYNHISDYRTLDIKGIKNLVKLPEDVHYSVEGIYLNSQNELVVYDRWGTIDYYNSLGERISKNDTLEIQLNAPNIFDTSTERFPNKEETVRHTDIIPMYVESYEGKGKKKKTILYFDVKTHPYTFRFKTYSSYIKNQEELSKVPTTYYTNDFETIESFDSISLYTHKNFHYQLLKVKNDFYMVK